MLRLHTPSSELSQTSQVLQHYQDFLPDIPSSLGASEKKQLRPTQHKCSVSQIQFNQTKYKNSTYQVCFTFFPVLMLMILTFSVPVRALSALLLLFLLLLFTRS